MPNVHGDAAAGASGADGRRKRPAAALRPGAGMKGADITLDQDIEHAQNTPDLLRLLRASSVAHSYAQRLDAACAIPTGVGVVMAIIASFRPRLQPTLVVISMITTLGVLFGLSVWSKRWTRTAMLLQERFDIELFGLPWDEHLGPRPLDREINELAVRSPGGSVDTTNWYNIGVKGLPRPIAVLLCQRENVSWDFRLRQRWSSVLYAAVLGWCGLGLTVAVIADWSVRGTIIRWLAPSLGGIVLAVDTARAHRAVADDKKSLALRVESLLNGQPSGPGNPRAGRDLLEEARRIQTEIARLRARTGRVPRQFYERYREADSRMEKESAARIRSRLLGEVTGSPSDDREP
jgi:hypothetical protein